MRISGDEALAAARDRNRQQRKLHHKGFVQVRANRTDLGIGFFVCITRDKSCEVLPAESFSDGLSKGIQYALTILHAPADKVLVNGICLTTWMRAIALEAAA